MQLLEGSVLDKGGWQAKLQLGDQQFGELLALELFAPVGERWRLQFVGSLFLRERAFSCLPAAAPVADFGRGPGHAVESTIKVLRQYQARSAARRVTIEHLGTTPAFNAANRKAFRQAEALLGLIDFTAQHGFHAETTEVSGHSAAASVDWAKTIRQHSPSKSGRSLVYFHLESRKSVPTVGRLGITQAVVLRKLAAHYASALPMTVESAREMCDEAHELTHSNPHLDALSTKRDLLDALDSTNLDHEKELASLLLAAHPEADARSGLDRGLGVFGTTAFELVWEDMCRVAIGGEKPFDGFELSNPRIVLADGSTVGVSPQRPDIVLKHEEQAYVLDAKYYPTFPSSVPALEDFRKQVFYVTSSRGAAPKTAFLIPGQVEGGLEKVGESNLQFADGTVDSRFAPVALLRLDYSTAVTWYLRGQAAPHLTSAMAGLLK